MHDRDAYVKTISTEARKSNHFSLAITRSSFVHVRMVPESKLKAKTEKRTWGCAKDGNGRDMIIG